MERDDVVDRVLRICRELHTLAANSYGPRGRVKVLLPNADVGVEDAVVTSKAERIVDRIGTSDCPIASVYIHILKSRVRGKWVNAKTSLVDCLIRCEQLHSHSDGGLLTMMLSAKLLLMVHDGCLSHTPLRLVSQGYKLALEWCMAYLDDALCPVRFTVDWSDTIGLFAVVRGILTAKPAATTRDFDDSFIRLLVDAYISVLPFVLAHPGESLPVRFIHDKAFASTLSSSRLVRRGIVLDRFHHCSSESTSLLPVRNASVLLFSISIGIVSEDATQASSSALASSSLEDNEEWHRSIVDRITSLGVGVVISQKLISDSLQSYLRARGVLCIQRLGIPHMHAVQLLTGATPIGDWRVLHDHQAITTTLGHLTSVSTIEASHKPMLQLENDRRGDRCWPVTTLVLTAPSDTVYAELTHEVMTTFKRLAKMMEQPEVVAGAGCVEIHLAVWLRRNSEGLVIDPKSSGPPQRGDVSVLRYLRATIAAFADALEGCVVALDHGVHGAADEVIEELRKANHESLSALPDTERYELYGWDPVAGSPRIVATVVHEPGSCSSDSSSEEDEDESIRQVDSAWVLDVLCTKKDALTAAVDCASALLRVAHVVDTHST